MWGLQHPGLGELAETTGILLFCFKRDLGNGNFQMCFVTLSKSGENSFMTFLACGPVDLCRHVHPRV